jgi:hypothetical protein
MRHLAVLPPLVAATLAVSAGLFAGPAMGGSNSAADSQYVDPLAPTTPHAGTLPAQRTPRASRPAATSSQPAAAYWVAGAAFVVLLAAAGLVIHRRTGRA